jgi:YkoY family integral membrane protein
MFADLFTLQSLLALLIIVVIESILSFDNAAVLAVIVNKNLKPEDRPKALRYGMIGAYVFRGLSLFLVSWILNNPMVGIWFKLLGGLYLIKLAYDGLMPKDDGGEDAPPSWADKWLTKLGLGVFWSTVIVVEVIDLVFSVDNLVAVVSLSNNMWVICIGVFIGIAVMRFVATKFSKLLEKYPSLETSAYIVIMLLGVKLAYGGAADYFGISQWLHHHLTDLIFSGVMMAIFFVPMLFAKKKYLTIESHDFSLQGTPKGIFRPDGGITDAEFIDDSDVEEIEVICNNPAPSLH